MKKMNYASTVNETYESMTASKASKSKREEKLSKQEKCTQKTEKCTNYVCISL